jgi:ATP-dependent Clp protease ATP-binding subunit ClpB
MALDGYRSSNMTETLTYPFTNRTYVALSIARGIAAGKGHINVTAAHIALGILREAENPAVAALQRGGVPLRHLRHELESDLPPDGHPIFGEVVLPTTQGELELIDLAAAEVTKLNDPFLGNEHLLLAMLYDPKGSVAQIVSRHGMTYETALAHLRVVRSGGH